MKRIQIAIDSERTNVNHDKQQIRLGCNHSYLSMVGTYKISSCIYFLPLIYQYVCICTRSSYEGKIPNALRVHNCTIAFSDERKNMCWLAVICQYGESFLLMYCSIIPYGSIYMYDLPSQYSTGKKIPSPQRWFAEKNV